MKKGGGAALRSPASSLTAITQHASDGVVLLGISAGKRACG